VDLPGGVSWMRLLNISIRIPRRSICRIICQTSQDRRQLEKFPLDLKLDESVQSVPILRTLPGGPQTRVIRAIARSASDGNALVIGREVTKREIPTSSARRCG